MRATVISDASYCPDTKAGGWAVWATLDGKERARQSGAFKTRPPSVNYAELWAALNAGGHIVLGVLGVMHPPIIMQVAATDGNVVLEGIRQ